MNIRFGRWIRGSTRWIRVDPVDPGGSGASFGHIVSIVPGGGFCVNFETFLLDFFIYFFSWVFFLSSILCCEFWRGFWCEFCKVNFFWWWILVCEVFGREFWIFFLIYTSKNSHQKIHAPHNPRKKSTKKFTHQKIYQKPLRIHSGTGHLRGIPHSVLNFYTWEGSNTAKHTCTPYDVVNNLKRNLKTQKNWQKSRPDLSRLDIKMGSGIERTDLRI